MARSSESVVREFIDGFVEAWPAADAARVASFFSADATYHNVPLEEVRGRWICEVHDGLITAWRDHFDLTGLAAGTGPDESGGRLP